MTDALSPSEWLVHALVATAYLMGGISPGWWLVRQKTGIDLRSQGSGVTGASNVRRVLGVRSYVAVLILDVAKGMAAVYLAVWLAPGRPWVMLAAPAVVAGHIWPIWLKFHGGRGAATLMGVCLALNPWIVPIAWMPGLAAWIAWRKGFAARAAAFLASLPAPWWLVSGTASRASFILAWLLVLLAHRSYLGKTFIR
jgi:glycerol-3-phosphate acyltransferase PlsY